MDEMELANWIILFSMALLEWITGPQGQELVEKAGYTPLAADGD